MLNNFIQLNKPFEIKVITHSSINKIYIENNIIKVKIKEIPENGKANKSLIELFSKTFKVPKKNINILKGNKSLNKLLLIKSI